MILAGLVSVGSRLDSRVGDAIFLIGSYKCINWQMSLHDQNSFSSLKPDVLSEGSALCCGREWRENSSFSQSAVPFGVFAIFRELK